jgi:hypothetical protein
MTWQNWVMAWINGGKFNGKEILPHSYVTEAISSQMVVAGGLPSKEHPDLQFANYGFGWGHDVLQRSLSGRARRQY